MTDTHIRYVELFVTAIKTSSFNDSLYEEEDEFNHTPLLFIDYFSLHETPDDIRQDIRTELDGVTRKTFQQNYGAGKLRDAQERKIVALYQTIDLMEPQREKTVPHAVVHSEKTLGKVYNFYLTKRAHKTESDVILYEFSEGQILDISHMLQAIGKGYLRLQVYQEIENHLEFNDFYSVTDRQVVDTPADACHQIWRKNPAIIKDKLLKKVLNEYHIKRYENKAPEVAERLTKKAVGQWLRDNKVNSLTN